MIETIETCEGFSRLAEDWRRLAAALPNPLLQYEWFEACAHAFCPPDRLHVIVVRRDGAARAIAPLALEGAHGKGSLSILGSQVLCEPSGFLYETCEDLEELLSHIVALRRPSHFRRLPARSPEVAFLEERSRGHAFQAERQSGSPWLPITGDWAAYEASISSKDRYTIRRARKRADALGSVTFETLVPRPCEVGVCFAELSRIESRSWKEANGTSLGSFAPLHRFFSRYMVSAAGAGMLRIHLLRIGPDAVAFLMGVEYARRMWVLKIGFDESFAPCSPGVLLMHEAIRSAFESRLEAFEFLGTDERWLHVWTDEVHRHLGVHLYPFSLSGLLHLGSDSSHYLLHRIPGRRHAAPKE